MTFSCTICKKTYASKHSLSIHNSRYHSKQKGYGEQTILKNLGKDNNTWDTASTKDKIDRWGLASTDGENSEASENSDGSENSLEEWKQRIKEDGKTKALLKKMKAKVKLYAKTMRDIINSDAAGNKSLNEAIYNEPTIAEMIKVERLVGKYRFDELVAEHIDALQKLLMGLSYGAIPLTQPQREEITDSQRKLVRELEEASPEEAGIIIKKNVQEIANLFTIIEDSLKLVRNSFQRFQLRKQHIMKDDVESDEDSKTDNSMED